MNTSLVRAIAIGTLLTIGHNALADHNGRYRQAAYGDEYGDYADPGYELDDNERIALSHEAVHYARVIHVEPLTRTVAVRTPVTRCWDEEVSYYDDDRRGRRYRSAAPATVAGGIIGGVIGRQFGDGKGRDAMTVIGTLVGSAVANEKANRRNYRGRYAQRYAETVERCETTDQVEYEERIDGYEVTYLYNDRRYTTRTDRDPGERIAVRVNVTPLTRY